MEFTEQQQLKIDRVLEFLKDYDSLDYDQYKNAIIKGADIIDYWLCDQDRCTNLAIKNLRKDLPKYSRLSVERYCNDGDHDSFESCIICGKSLNKYLTWYNDELDFLIEQIRSKDDMVKESNCFKIVGLLESAGWLDDSTNSEKSKEKLLDFVDLLYSFDGVGCVEKLNV
jgi:hypothetical protein